MRREIIIVIFFSVFFSSLLSAQKKEIFNSEYQIEFIHTFNYKEIGAFMEYNSTLWMNSDSSLYAIHFSQVEDSESVVENEDGTFSTTRILSGNDRFFLTNDKTTVSEEDIYGKTFLLNDEFSKLKWKLEEETKEILNYQCQKATIQFRGRDYNVWFTDELPNSFGPWKFGGLPGGILLAESTDGVIKIEPSKIIRKSNSVEYKLNTKLNSLDWEEFVKLYKQKEREVFKKLKSEEGTNVESSSYASYRAEIIP